MKRVDEHIKKDIVDELYWDDRIDASKISVTVDEGVVNLTGQVPSYGDLALTRTAAWRIAGVTDVVDNLQVGYISPPALPGDSEIKSQADSLLLWDPTIDEKPIEITVIDGVVTLSGTIDAYWKKMFVEDKLFGLRGVLDIKNKLAVVPSQRLSDELVARNIVAAMERDVMVESEDVNVEVNNGVVHLTGKVPSWTTRYYAELDAARTAGVVDVTNELRIAA